MPLLELIMLLWIAIGGLGIIILAVLIVAVIVGGLYDLYRCLADQRADARRARGLCPRCGYDMHACAHRCCPECGLPARSFPHPNFLHT